MGSRRARRTTHFSAIVAALLPLACAEEGDPRPSGTGGGGGTGGDSSGGSAGTVVAPPPGQGPGVIAQCRPDAAPAVGPSPLRRISRLEYESAARDVFGDTGKAASASGFPSDEKIGSFVSNTVTTLSPTNNEGYLTAAEGVAARFAARFSEVSGCALGDPACTDAFLLGAARRAFHGTLEPADAAALTALRGRVAGQVDAAAGVEAVVRSILLSPRFLYMVEFGAADGVLTPSEVAGRLAAFLWRTVPDQPLLDAADAGQLASAEQIMQRAASMLTDRRADAMLDDFALQWLDVEDVGRISRDDAAFTPALRDAMARETSLTFQNAARGTTTFPALLTADASYVNADLAALYGVPAPATEFALTPLPAHRRGVLMQAAFLAMHAHPQHPSQVLRGKAVREQILCDRIPLPPPGVERNIGVGADQTTQQAFDAHTQNDACVGCHSWLDPVGYGFNFYDQIGRYRETENGLAVSAQGQIVRGPSSTVTGSFTSATELVELLASSEYVQQCFAVQATRFALGRDEQPADACSVKSIWDRFVAGQLNVRELFVTITGTVAFARRDPVQAGARCR